MKAKLFTPLLNVLKQTIRCVLIALYLLILIIAIACIAFAGVGTFLVGIAGVCLHANILSCIILFVAGLLLFTFSFALIIRVSEQPWII